MHKTSNVNIAARDGYQLTGTLREPEAEPLGYIQLHTGTGIPQKLYGNLAAFLAENGYVTLTFDYRGIGLSKPDSLKGFEAKMSDWGTLDMTGVLDWAAAKYPNLKKTVVAHSVGGQLLGLMDNHELIDRCVTIASCTGYWRDMSAPYRWSLLPLWYFFIPFTIQVYGYANARKIRQGENLPAGVAMEWRKWCVHPDYLASEFGKSLNTDSYEHFKAPITSIQIADDPIANETTCAKLMSLYSGSEIKVRKVAPADFDLKRIGHAGYFSRKFKHSLWPELLQDLAS